MPDKIKTYRRIGMPTTEKERHRMFKAQRQDKGTNAFYSSRPWRVFRAAHLSAHPLCEDCQREGVTIAANVVDHIEEVKDRPDLALDSTNVRSLCTSHHNAKTGRNVQERKR